MSMMIIGCILCAIGAIAAVFAFLTCRHSAKISGNLEKFQAGLGQDAVALKQWGDVLKQENQQLDQRELVLFGKEGELKRRHEQLEAEALAAERERVAEHAEKLAAMQQLVAEAQAKQCQAEAERDAAIARRDEMAVWFEKNFVVVNLEEHGLVKLDHHGNVVTNILQFRIEDHEGGHPMVKVPGAKNRLVRRDALIKVLETKGVMTALKLARRDKDQADANAEQEEQAVV